MTSTDTALILQAIRDGDTFKAIAIFNATAARSSSQDGEAVRAQLRESLEPQQFTSIFGTAAERATSLR